MSARVRFPLDKPLKSGQELSHLIHLSWYLELERCTLFQICGWQSGNQMNHTEEEKEVWGCNKQEVELSRHWQAGAGAGT